jgi:AmmeMemoRadiSam system protein A
MADFAFTLDPEEKTYLKDLVHASIRSGLEPEQAPADPPEPPTPRLQEHLGAFVTLKSKGQLRGCIGHVVGDQPLYLTVWQMARNAAFGDPRFAPITLEEFQDLEVEISILSPLEPCPDPEQIRVGRHGLVVAKGARTGLLLPQVAEEWNWDRGTFLRQTCNKAGLPANCWRDPEVQLYWFQAEVF